MKRVAPGTKKVPTTVTLDPIVRTKITKIATARKTSRSEVTNEILLKYFTTTKTRTTRNARG